LTRPFQLTRILSLDVVAGAACGGLLAEHVTGVRMTAAWWVCLVAAVWSVYTADHLLDARRGRNLPTTDRHAFHLRHAVPLAIALSISVVVGFVASASLTDPVRHLGYGLSALVVIYLASAQGVVLNWIPKEVAAGGLYAAGIWCGPLLMSASASSWAFFAAFLQAVAAILNLTSLGIFESELDRAHATRSLALRFGSVPAKALAVVLGAIFTALALGAAVTGPPEQTIAFGVLAIQVATPALMLLASGWFGGQERYRSWGDSVFFLGALPKLIR
jgi:hypothetical protein